MSGGWDALHSLLEAGRPFADAVCVTRVLGGVGERHVAFSGDPLAAGPGAQRVWHGIARDVSEADRGQERLRHLAHRDRQTSLPIRAATESAPHQMLEDAAQDGLGVHVMFVDLDGFKAVNDRHGHTAGDRVLQQSANRLRAVLRDEDVLGRFGGDESVVVLFEQRSAGDDLAARVLLRLRDPIVPPIPVDGAPRQLVPASGSRPFPTTRATCRCCRSAQTPRCTTRSACVAQPLRAERVAADRRARRRLYPEGRRSSPLGLAAVSSDPPARHTHTRDDPTAFEGPRMSVAAPAADSVLLSGLARALVQHDLLQLEQAVAVQKKADAADAEFIDEVVSGGTMPAARLARFAADTFGLPLVDLAALDATAIPADLIDTKLLAESPILPIAKRGNRLTVLLSDPTDLQAIDRVKFRAQATVDPIVVEHDKLLKLVERLSRSLANQTDAADDDSSDFQLEETDRAGSMGAAAGDTMLSGLARAMVQHQLLGLDQAVAVQKKADAADAKFIDEVVSGGTMPAARLARFAADTFGLPLVDLAALDATAIPADLIDTKLLAESLILPIAKQGNRLTVLLSDPTDLQAIDRVKFLAQATVDPIVVEHGKLLKLVERLSRSLADQTDAADDDSSDFQLEETDRAGSMGAAAGDTVLSSLARALVQHQLVRPEQATAIQRTADAAQRKFIDELVSSGQLRAVTLARFASDTFGLPLMDLAALDADILLTDLIDTKLLAETLILPIAKRGNRLTVLLSDPTDLQAIDRVKFRAQATVDPIVVEHDRLLKFVEQLSQSLADQLEPVEEDFFQDLPMGIEEGDIRVFDENAPLRSATPK
jgi:GGDEF domain-containing protein/type II secretory ATPase GspE/PulE/Tfp pilus assembly ATPase PilB-like protein